jgi:hypothetical protein
VCEELGWGMRPCQIQIQTRLSLQGKASDPPQSCQIFLNSI